jgi:hypothetical protein
VYPACSRRVDERCSGLALTFGVVWALMIRGAAWK